MSVRGAAQDPRADMRFGGYRVPDVPLESDDIEAQEMIDLDGDISGDSTEMNVEGGMTVAFKVFFPRL